MTEQGKPNPTMTGPDSAGQRVGTRRSGILGFVSDEIGITPYAGKIYEGAQDAAWKQGKTLIMADTKNAPQLQAAAFDMLMDRQVEGIIYGTMYHRAVNPPDLLRAIPSVLLDCFVADHSLPSVVPDEVGGAYKATSVLLEKGHRRGGFAKKQKPTPPPPPRPHGYLAALSAPRLPF